MKKSLSVLILFTPTIALAEQFQNLGDVLEWLLALVNDYFIPLLVAIALLAFFWRNIVALAKKDELVQKAEIKWYLFWGVIALFVMVSVWGLVGILADAFGIRNAIPQLDTGSGGGGDANLPPCSIAEPDTPCDAGDGGSGNLLPCSIATPGDPCTPTDPFVPGF